MNKDTSHRVDPQLFELLAKARWKIFGACHWWMIRWIISQGISSTCMLTFRKKVERNFVLLERAHQFVKCHKFNFFDRCEFLFCYTSKTGIMRVLVVDELQISSSFNIINVSLKKNFKSLSVSTSDQSHSKTIFDPCNPFEWA
jgi:hypothetical protein